MAAFPRIGPTVDPSAPPTPLRGLCGDIPQPYLQKELDVNIDKLQKIHPLHRTVSMQSACPSKQRIRATLGCRANPSHQASRPNSDGSAVRPTCRTLLMASGFSQPYQSNICSGTTQLLHRNREDPDLKDQPYRLFRAELKRERFHHGSSVPRVDQDEIRS